ncbi:MAG: nitroreductase family protein, partial [Methyloceanibacter sp.]
MELLDAINGRMSVREYTEEPVNDAVLRELIEAAIEAPSAINQQPWAFIVVKDRECLTRISDRAKTHLLKASL